MPTPASCKRSKTKLALAALIATTSVFVISMSARADVLDDFPFDVTDQYNEYSPEKIRSAVDGKKDETEFVYLNPASREDACSRPLTVEEKVDQQAGRVHRDQLQGRHQLSRYRDGWLNKKIDSSSFLSPVLAQYKWKHLWAFVSHPSIGILYGEVSAVRERTWDLQDREFGTAEGIGESDQADAFRHFVGAGLLWILLGKENTEIVLHVHEEDDVSMSSLMDRYNNEIALREIAKLESQGRLNEAVLIEQAKALIASNTLVVLRPRDLVGRETAPVRHAKFRAWAHARLRMTLD